MRTQLILLAFCLTPVLAQVGNAPEERIEIQQIRQQRQRAEKNAAIEEARRKRILERYDEAITALEAEAAAKRTALRLEQERTQVDSTVGALRAELSKPQQAPAFRIPDNPTIEDIEIELARARTRLDGSRTALRAAEQQKMERDQRRNDISKRLGKLDQQLEALSEQQRTERLDATPEMADALNASLRAQKQSGAQEIQTLRVELTLLEKRSALIPLRVDLAQRRVSSDEQVVAMLEAEAANVRAEQAVASLNQVTKLSENAKKSAPALTAVADETVALARRLWAPDGVLNQYAIVGRRLASARKSQADLDRIVGLIRRQFLATGRRNTATYLWPKPPDDFPKTGEVEAEFDALQQGIPEVQQELIRLEDWRGNSSDLRLETLQALRRGPGASSPESERLAEKLLSARQDLLDQLVQGYGRYSNQLVELDSTLDSFLQKLQASEASLYESVLWLRSAPVTPEMSNFSGAIDWYFAAENWSPVFPTMGRGFRALPMRGIGIGLLLVLLVWSRRRLVRRLNRLAELVRDSNSIGSLRHTLEAIAITIALAAPVPVALYALDLLLSGGQPSPFLFAAEKAVGFLVYVVVLLEFWRQVLRPNGLGEAHFGWKLQSTGTTYRGLLVSEVLLLLPLFIALHCAYVGMRLSSPAELQSFNNSLGRLAFVIAMILFALPLLSVFRPGVDILDRRLFPRWPRPYVYAYLFIFVSVLLPAVLAVAAFYLTGFLLAFQAFRMMGLVVLLLVLASTLERRRRIQFRHATALLGTNASVHTAELKEADAHIGKLFRFVVLVVASIGLYGIWSEALPVLQIMKRVQILPTLALLDTFEERAQEHRKVAREAESAKSASSPAPAAGVPSPVAAVVPGGSPPPTENQSPEPSGLTLWSVFQAVIAAAITWALVSNIPGMLALSLRRRTKFDSGARVAFITLARYVLLIFGASATFGLLGITWSKIQWLAAALTFGLGFGLQEIVANFVSGLILLVERPIRVGDVVTVGDLQGSVNRIQIRSTTIGLWDGSEMIVPNKEFITTKLLNWTLSDTKRRIEILLRVAYGADILKVKELLLDVVRRNPRVLADPEPVAVIDRFGEDALKFELRFFVQFDTTVQTKQEVYEAIDQVFRQEGIRFGLPRLDIQLGDGQLDGQTEPPPSDALSSTLQARKASR